ncbi:MAG: DUF4280 domain-containing protein [Spirulina sp. SIO3F2]|nr:DUF4280 domain-containing protein [Spirulina sp. SIO3F2]
MAKLVAMGAALQCSFGSAPTSLIVIPKGATVVNAPYTFAATTMDFAPIVNIPTFVMCSAPSNPAVIAATSAALGVFTPAPCVPVTTPWKPGATKVKIGTFPALTDSSTCNCAWGGVIKVSFAGQTITDAT